MHASSSAFICHILGSAVKWCKCGVSAIKSLLRCKKYLRYMVIFQERYCKATNFSVKLIANGFCRPFAIFVKNKGRDP